MDVASIGPSEKLSRTANLANNCGAAKIRVVARAQQIIKIVTQFTKLPVFWSPIAHVAIALNGSAARGDRFHIKILQCKIGFVFLVRCHTLASIG
jgi:hypothetical protein